MPGAMKFAGRDGNRQGGGQVNDNRPMFKAVCANCGRSCEVPFKPSGDRPIYCRDCFRARNEGGGVSAPQQRGGSGKPFTPRPTPQGAVRHASHGGVQPANTNALAAQLAAMNGKLDRLLSLLENAPAHSSRAAKPAGKKAAAKKKSQKRK